MTTTDDVLGHLNEHTAGRWRRVRALGGGHQSGATEVSDGERRAVLKWSPRPLWAKRVLSAVDTVAFARTRGYPSPAWLAWETTPEGYPYVLYDYVDGEAHRVLGPLDAATDLALIERQIAMRPPTALEWSGYIEASVLDDVRGDQARLRARGGPAAGAMTAVTNVARGLHSPCLARDDLVHGDLSLSNLIFERARFAAWWTSRPGEPVPRRMT